jgi:hypothetical protein
LFGDVIYLKNGRKFEGKLVSESAGEYVFKIKGLGKQTFKKSDVDKLEIGETIFDQYEAKRKAVKSDDADGLYDLGKWCLENDLKKEAKKAFESAVAANGDHAGARAELGFVKYEGKWIPAEEMKEILAKIAAEEAALIAGLGLGSNLTDEEARFSIAAPRDFEQERVKGLSVRFTGPALGVAPIVILLERTDSAGGLEALLTAVKEELEVPHEDLQVTAEPAAAELSGQSGKLLSFTWEEGGVSLEHKVVCAVFPDFDLRLSLTCAQGRYEQLKAFFEKVTASVKALAKPADGSSTEWGYEFNLPDETYRAVDNFPINIQGVDWKAPAGAKTVLGASRGYMVVIGIFPGKKSDSGVDASSLETLRDSLPGSFPQQFGVQIQGESKSLKVGGEEALTGNLTGLGGVGRFAVVMHGDNHYRLTFMNLGNGMGQNYVTQDFEKFLAGFRFK